MTSKLVLNAVLTASCRRYHSPDSDGKCHSTECLAAQPAIKDANPQMRDISQGCEAYKLLPTIKEVH